MTKMKKIILDEKYILGFDPIFWAKSYENGVVKGDVRVIDGMLMTAHKIYPRIFSKNKVLWVPVGPNAQYEYKNNALRQT